MWSGVQAAYWGMLDEGRITQSTANILMQSVDEALDFVSDMPLCDWKGLKANVHFPNYYKYFQRSIFPQKLVTYFTVDRLESSCYICAAFLRAHRIARQQLHDFIGNHFLPYKLIFFQLSNLYLEKFVSFTVVDVLWICMVFQLLLLLSVKVSLFIFHIFIKTCII